MLFLRREGGVIRNGLNFYPPSEWRVSRGFIFKAGCLKYRFRYSVALGRVSRGWEKAPA